MTSKALQAPKRRSRLNRLNGVDYAIMAFLALFALIILYPFYNSICVSLVSQADYIKTVSYTHLAGRAPRNLR